LTRISVFIYNGRVVVEATREENDANPGTGKWGEVRRLRVAKSPILLALLVCVWAGTAPLKAGEKESLAADALPIAIGAFRVEGMDAQTGSETLAAFVSETGSCGGTVTPPAGQGQTIEAGCFRSPGCLRGTCANLGVLGVMEIEAIRAGPVVKVDVYLYDCESGELAFHGECSAPAEGFPGSLSVARLIGPGLEKLRNKTQQRPPTEPGSKEREKPEEAMAPMIWKVEVPVDKPAVDKPAVDRPAVDKLLAMPEAVIARTETVTRRTDPARTWGWVTLGAGGGLLAGALVTGIWALSLNDELGRQCAGGICPDSLGAKVEQLDRLTLATDVMVGIGAAVVTAGILVLTLSGSEESGAQEGITLTPAVGTDHAGAFLRGRF
jgi:hypothetical protein